MINISVPTTGWIMGRNGLRGIKEVTITEYGDMEVKVDGIGVRGTVINGGLAVDPIAMDKVAIEWLVERGFGVRYPRNWKGYKE